MSALAKYVSTRLLVMLLAVSLAFAPVAIAQYYAPAQARPAFTQQELDQMLAPIALYPDPLLSQILMASTYPYEVAEAARWSRANPDLSGERAVNAVEPRDWDPEVKSLVAFPQILARLDENPEWTKSLGDAFISQQPQLMDAIQSLRQRAYAAGYLGSSEQIRVAPYGGIIAVEPANPQVIYVPYYDPLVVYGSWWWPGYPPVYWAPRSGYYVRPGFAARFAWGTAVAVSKGFFFGGFDWHRRHATVVNVNNYHHRQPASANRQTHATNAVIARNVNAGPGAWQHDPPGRDGVSYREASPRRQSGRASASSESRADVSGRDTLPLSAGGHQAVRPDARGVDNARSAARGVRESRPQVERQPGAFAAVSRSADARDVSPHARDSSHDMTSVHHGAPALQPSAHAAAPQPSGNAPTPRPSSVVSAAKPIASRGDGGEHHHRSGK